MIGLEPTFTKNTSRTCLQVFREVWRVLRDDGIAWLNYGDAYAGSGKGHAAHHANVARYQQVGPLPMRGGDTRQQIGPDAGLPAKNIIGMPWRVAFDPARRRLDSRSPIVWEKNNPMPEISCYGPAYERLRDDLHADETAAVLERLRCSTDAQRWGHQDARRMGYWAPVPMARFTVTGANEA